MPDQPPLDGIRVLDFSQVAAGPYATSLLGDLGANVIKVESPDGDPFRATDDIMGPGESAYFYGVNRSKRAIVLDLRDPASRDAVTRLTQWADVVVVGFRPSAVEKLGLGYDRLAAVNPHIVYCSLTAYGEDGPRASEPGMDILAQAIGGVMGLTGEPDRAPVKVGPPIADFVASYLIGFAVCAALLAVRRDGKGQKITINLLDGQVSTLANYVTPYMRSKVPIRPVGGGHPQLVPYQVFTASDGYLVIGCMSDKFWRPLTSAISMPELGSDQRFATNSGRLAAREEVVSRIQQRLSTHPVGHWIARLTAAGVPCGPVNRLEDALGDPQVVHNKMLRTLHHPELGDYTVVDNPMRLDRTPARPRGYAPKLGEHTAEVLAELGFTPEEVDALTSSGVAGADLG